MSASRARWWWCHLRHRQRQLEPDALCGVCLLTELTRRAS